MITKQKSIAYFCMEFGLDAKFEIYSGGLGILAGDILKAAKDIQAPVVGVGILWRQGYGTQFIDKNGKPYDSFHENIYDFVQDTGVVVEVQIRNKPVKLKVHKCDCFGNATLYLLDAFIENNNDWLITSQLYGWFNEERIAQEIILGVGGLLALEALKIDVDIYHFNDSHPVIAGLELVRREMKTLKFLNELIGEDVIFENAIENVRKKIVFTTHTPIIHGNEYYNHEILKYMGATTTLSYQQMVRIGEDPFCMTVAGLNLSKISNAVSQLHGETAKDMWKNVKKGSQIIPITNGVHNATWQQKEIFETRNNHVKLKEEHESLKQNMIDYVFEKTGQKLKKNILTIGFARRAAKYKRADLIFKTPIIAKLLEQNKIQIIFSGKAHPNDIEGKNIIKNLFEKSKQYPDAVVFLQNYNIEIGKILTRGCDVWLNNPQRPLEASGTSGMKAAMNGVLNVSILDGWWPEGCVDGETGWQFGEGQVDLESDEIDIAALSDVLENKVIDTYYNNQKKWLCMMQKSIEMSSEKFSAKRMLQDYFSKIYGI